jgi:hypothetical protein
MYAGVPSTAPVLVTDAGATCADFASASLVARPSSVASSASRASPKSVTRTPPSRPTITFWGLKSRCTTPAACAAASPRPAATNTSTISRQPRDGVADRNHWSMVSPSTNSIAM